MHEQFWRKGSVGVSRDCPIFLGTPFYLWNGKSYGFQIWPVCSEGLSEQKLIKILEKNERGRIQGLLNFGGTPYYLRIELEKLRISNLASIHSEGPSEYYKSPCKILEKRKRGRIQVLPNFGGIPYYLRNRKSYVFQIGQYNQRVHPNKIPLKIRRKGSVDVSRDCPIFSGTP